MIDNQRVLIINTGGTIGMKSSDQGYEVAPGFLQEQLLALPELKRPSMPVFEMTEFDPVVDSAEMTPDYWVSLAQIIESKYEEFDSFVIAHGTDTMAYTASALAFMLQGLSKTVILTGSQIPLCEVRNDARDNLITALWIAGNYRIPEVCILFGEELVRGCRARKVSVNDFDAFRSPNDLPIGEIGTQIRIFENRMRRQPVEDFRIVPFGNVRLGTFRLFPGVSAEVLENLLLQPLQGLILETYGVGTGPTKDAEFLRVLKEATDRGVVIVSCSQCEHGTVSPRNYASGFALAETGVLSGGDMTIEAAIAKLHFLLTQNLSIDEIRCKIEQNLVGELTPPTTPSELRLAD